MIKPRLIAILSLLTLATSLAWLAMLIAGMAQAGPLDTYEAMRAYAGQQGPLWVATYANVALVTLLAIPSILFSVPLYRQGRRWAAGLLAANGAACLVGLIGILAGSSLLSAGSLVGGVLFILTMPPLAAGFREG